MPIRLLEVTLPNDRVDEVRDVLGDETSVKIWTIDEARRSMAGGKEGDTAVLRILLDARESESVTDALTHAFGHHDLFRIVMLPVEATVPGMEEDDQDDADPNAEPAKKSPLRISREELYEDIAEASQLNRVYMMLVVLSTVVAAVGMVRGDVAIIIGAMLIAPLLGPNVALALAAALGDPDLAQKAIKTSVAGLMTALGLSAVLGFLLVVDPSEPELLNRTTVSLGDVIVALAAGAAGSLAFTSGVPAVVVGVMVAVALLPPLVAVGLLVGSGNTGMAAGALVLLLTNVTCVNLSAIATFYVQKVRPRTWWEADRARKATHRAAAAWVALLAVLIVLIWFFF